MIPLPTRGWRNDALAKVTGRAKYAGDLKLPGLLHGAPVYTDFVHARLLEIDGREAERLPGVVRVLTARDVPGSNRLGQIVRDLRVFADDKIRYHGEAVALVVATSREVAIAAAQLVRVQAVPLPAVLDPEEAMRPGAPLVHEERGTNVVATHRVRRGNCDAGFAAADFVVEENFRTSLVEHAYLEPETALCLPRPDGTVEVHASLQHPFSARRFVADCLGAPLAAVEVMATPMGGGFGGKDDTAGIVCARTALAARLLGRPVRTAYRRDWSMRESYKRHPYRIRYKLGLSRDGRFVAAECRIVADGGAYCSVTPWVTWRSTVQCCGPYAVEHVRCDAFGVYTNNVAAGAMRGFGSPQINFALEQMVEIAAERLGLSPVEIRRRNLLRQNGVTITGQRLDRHRVSAEEVLDAVRKDIDYDAKRARCPEGRSADEELYGIGLAMSSRGVSLGAEGTDACGAIVEVQPDGSVVLESGVHENGQGAESAMAILAAGELGLGVERIRYRRGSTSTIPDSGPTAASRGTVMGGGAVTLAVRELKARIARFAAARLSCPAEAVRFHDACLQGPDGSSLPFAAAVAAMFAAGEIPRASAVFRAPAVSWDESTGQGDAYFTWVYGCQAVELTVNRKTGRVTLLGAVAAHDAGRVVHPEMLRGQYFGGMAMGIGYALHEEVKTAGGRIRSVNLNSYRIPRATDLPEMRAIPVEHPDPSSPSGAKSIGEPTNELMAPAIANALYAATGRRHFSLPLRPQPMPVPAPERVPP